MIFTIQNFKDNPTMSFRRAGYIFQRHAGSEMSFVRSFSASGYPRFHIYTKMDGTNLEVSIHLDMKKETYGTDTRHHGEYEDNEALRDEVERLKNVLA